MHEVAFLQDLAVVMLVAVVTVIFHRLKQPVVLGYILAGVIIGPHTPPSSSWIRRDDPDVVRTGRHLPDVLARFGVQPAQTPPGRRHRAHRGLLEILVMVFAGYQLGRLFGWGTMDSIFLGAILSISSTTIIIKALEELGKTRNDSQS